MHDVRDVFVLGIRHTLQCLFVVEKVHLRQQVASNRSDSRLDTNTRTPFSALQRRKEVISARPSNYIRA